ncbi:MAG: glycosyltransferase family 87 protein [Terriglobales bacterium]|jgi:hypothetical protein
MRPGISYKPLGLVLAAAVCAAGVWLYANRVLIPHQISDAAAQGRPRGNLSDLYLHWVGARELLLNGRNPYSPEVTREIQQGYYGRPLDPSRPGDPRDQRFAYPVYVTFLLAPTLHLPFEIVRKGFLWFSFWLTVATVPLWLRVLRWSPPLWTQVSLVVFTLGSLPVMQGLKLQQMTLLVAAFVVIGLALLASHQSIAAGVALALATIKPQLVWLLLFWLMLWTLADWRRRYRWAASFLFTMTILCAAAEWYLPHWIPQFIQAMREYPTYTDAVSTLDKLLASPWAWITRALAVAATLHVGWKNRMCAQDTVAFTLTVVLILTVTIIVIPSYALYNEVLLLPALLMLVRDYKQRATMNSMGRALLALAAILLLWQWATSIVLAGLSFVLPAPTVQAAWAVPLWTVLHLPVVVAALVLIMSYRKTFPAAAGPGSS